MRRAIFVTAFLVSAICGALAQAAGPVVAGQAMAQQAPSGGVAIVAAPAPSATVVDTGSIAGQALTWVVTTFGGTVGLALTTLLMKMLQKKNIEISDAARARLQEIIVNGLNLGAGKVADSLRNRGQIEVKNAAVAQAIEYTKAHGADTLKTLGLDPTSPQAVEAIRARIETAIADKDTATHPALDQPKAATPGPSQAPTTG